MVGEIERGEFPMGNLIRVTRDRSKAVDFSRGVLTTSSIAVTNPLLKWGRRNSPWDILDTRTFYCTITTFALCLVTSFIIGIKSRGGSESVFAAFSSIVSQGSALVEQPNRLSYKIASFATILTGFLVLQVA